MAKTKYKLRSGSTKIDVAKDRIYKVSDPVALSKLFFPNNDAKHKRAAFLAIIFEIRNSSYQKARPTRLNKIPKKYEINKSSYFKARAKMARIGVISKAAGYWKFADGFEKAIELLISNLNSLRFPAESVYEENQEYLNVQTAKIDKIYYQLMKKDE